MRLREVRLLQGLEPQRSDMHRGRSREGKLLMVVVVVVVVMRVAGRCRRVRRQALARLVMLGRCLPVDWIRLANRRRVLAFWQAGKTLMWWRLCAGAWRHLTWVPQLVPFLPLLMQGTGAWWMLRRELLLSLCPLMTPYRGV